MSYYQQIYDRLRKEGFSEAGALGVLGNWECESNCEPCRLQGDFGSFRTVSRQYVWDVTNGRISRNTFAHDGKGWGLPQWTFWSRKDALYDFWKKSGKTLDDLDMQMSFALKEFRESFASDLATLKTITDIEEACRVVCARFENPQVHNVTNRYKAALRIKDMIDLDAWKDGGGDEPTPAPTPTPVKDHSLTLRTIDWHCENFKEFALLKALLECRNYDTADWDNDGVWDALAQFQKDNGLIPDKICGNQTWTALLKR